MSDHRSTSDLVRRIEARNTRARSRTGLGSPFPRTPHRTPGGASSATPSAQRMRVLYSGPAARASAGPNPLRGPLITAGVLAGGATLFAGVGLAQLAFGGSDAIDALKADHESAAPAVVAAPDAAPVSLEGPSAGAAAEADRAIDDTADRNTATSLPDFASGGRGSASVATGTTEKIEVDAPEESEPVQTVIVEPGDTLSDISGRTGVSVEHLLAANGIANPDFIYAGAALVVPPQ